LVVHGSDGTDEITITGPTFVAELRAGEVREYEIRPEDFGISPAPAAAIRGGDARENARIVQDVLSGAKGPCRDVVAMNAAAALVVAEAADDFHEGVRTAAAVIDAGQAFEKLKHLVELTNR
jgi:anthranilate phosphoribosyltransferase